MRNCFIACSAVTVLFDLWTTVAWARDSKFPMHWRGFTGGRLPVEMHFDSLEPSSLDPEVLGCAATETRAVFIAAGKLTVRTPQIEISNRRLNQDLKLSLSALCLIDGDAGQVRPRADVVAHADNGTMFLLTATLDRSPVPSNMRVVVRRGDETLGFFIAWRVE